MSHYFCRELLFQPFAVTLAVSTLSCRVTLRTAAGPLIASRRSPQLFLGVQVLAARGQYA